MSIVFHRNFKQQYKKLRAGEKKKCDERIALFMQDPKHPVLNNHALGGQYKNYRSINITGDLRAFYEITAQDTTLFIIIDTHSHLYS